MGSPSDKSSHGEEAAAFQANPQSSDPWNFGAGRAKNIQAGQEMVAVEFHLWSGLEKKAQSSFQGGPFQDRRCRMFAFLCWPLSSKRVNPEWMMMDRKNTFLTMHR